MLGSRFVAIVASFLVFHVLADLSRTGLCEDSDQNVSVVLMHDGLSRPDVSDKPSPIGNNCFCCSLTIEPNQPFKINDPPTATLTIIDPAIRTIPVLAASIY